MAKTEIKTKNSLCSKCLRQCKQIDTVLLLDCPRYLPRPFKSPAYAFDQLELFASPPKSSR